MSDQRNLTELKEKRTKSTSTYKVEGEENSYVLESSSSPIHYEESPGVWRKFDLNLDANGQISKAPYKVHLLPDKLGYEGEGPDGKHIALTLDGNYVDPIINENTATYEELEPGVDFKLVFTTRSIKALRILKNKDANKVATYNSFREPGAVGQLINAGIDDDKRPTKIKIDKQEREDGWVSIRQEFENKVLNIDPKTRVRSWGDDIKYPVIIDPTSSFTPNAGASPGMGFLVEFYSSFPTPTSGTSFNRPNTGLPDLSLYNATFPPSYARPVMTFPVSNIPMGTTITSANLQYYHRRVYGYLNAGGYLFCQDAASPVLASTATTTAVKNIPVAPTTVPWATVTQTSFQLQNIDVTTTVQNRVTSYGYDPGNMTFVWYRNAGPSGNIDKIRAFNGVNVEPKLVITYGGAPPASTFKPKIIFS